MTCPLNSVYGDWKANSPSLAGEKVKLRWPLLKGDTVGHCQFPTWSCTSVPVLYTAFYSSFSLVRLRKHSQFRKKCSEEIIMDEFCPIEHLKGFTSALWPNKFAKLSKDDKSP